MLATMENILLEITGLARVQNPDILDARSRLALVRTVQRDSRRRLYEAIRSHETSKDVYTGHTEPRDVQRSLYDSHTKPADVQSRL